MFELFTANSISKKTIFSSLKDFERKEKNNKKINKKKIYFFH